MVTEHAPSPGTYHRPSDLNEALWQADRKPATILAGGTDLVLLRADRVIDPSLDVIDIKGISELIGVRCLRDGTTVIGAATRLQELARSVPSNAITDGAGLVGGWQTRARATIGGNICRASPAGDTLPGTLVVNARFRLASIRGSRWVAAAEFFVGPGRTVLGDGEILTEIRLPGVVGGSAYKRFTYRRAMDLAVVGVAAHVQVVDGICTRAVVSVGAAAATPVLAPDAADALVGTTLDDAAIARAAELVVAASSPIDDGRGTRQHRLHVLPALTRAALASAHQRALETLRGGER